MQSYLALGVVTLLLVGLNSFFVMAEFALVRVRQTRIAELADAGNSRAKQVRALLSRLDTYLSATQLGVTLASLGLGYITEPAMSVILRPAVRLMHLNPDAARVHDGIAIVGFLIITSITIIFGELLPKWWVIAHTEETALRVALPMQLFLRLGYPLIKVLEESATALARVLKIEPGQSMEQAHSEDEILAIMAHSHREGALRPSEVEIAENVFDFAHTQAREIMVPRVDMIYISTTWTIEENVRVAIENGFTRYPLCEGDRDHVLGMVHIKDLLALSTQKNADIASIVRPMLAIPETKPIDELLKELQKSHSHQAVVIDEYGGTAGLVTLEDIIEELIGEIQDEHDKPPDLHCLDPEAGRYSIDANVAISDVAETLGMEIANPDEYETIGGYALHQLRMPPRVGATAKLDGYDVTIAEVTGRRIRRLLFQRRGATTTNQPEPCDEASLPADRNGREPAEAPATVADEMPAGRQGG